MYTLELLRSLSNKYLSYIIHSAISVIGLSFLLSAGACNNYEIGSVTDNSMDMLNMTIPKALLIGNENKIETIFQISNGEKRVNLADFKLKVSILEQETFIGSTTGSQVSHRVPTTGKEDFSGTFEKFLTEFTTVLELGPTHGQNELTVDFDLLPAQEAIKVKLLFELLDEMGKTIQTREVKWIKDAVAINSPVIFEGEKTLIVLKSLEKDIKDLSKIVLQLRSDEEKARFYFKSNGQSVATLADLLGDTSKIFSEKVTNPIEITVDAEDRVYTAKVTIMVFDTNAIDDSRPLGKKEIHWNGIKLNQKADQDQEGLKREQQGQGGGKQESSQPQQQEEKKDGRTEEAVKEELKKEQQEPIQSQQQDKKRGEEAEEASEDETKSEGQKEQGSKEEFNQPQQGEQVAKGVEKEFKDEATSAQTQKGQTGQQIPDKPLQTEGTTSTVGETTNDKLDDIQKEEQVLEHEIDELQQREEATKQEDISQPDNSLKEEEKKLEKKVNKFMKRLDKKKKKELKGKSKKEKEIISHNYDKQKQEIKEKLHQANKNLKDRREHTRGFLNALGHNMFGIPLKSDDSRSSLYKEGQLNGHRAAVVVGRTETALGGTLTSVGVATLVAGTGPTLGGAAVGSAALIGAGLAGVAHGIAAAERAQANLARAKEAASEKSDTSHETAHHVHVETHATQEEASVKVKNSEEKS